MREGSRGRVGGFNQPSVGLRRLVGLAVLGVVLSLPAIASAQLTDEEKKYLEEKKEGPSTVYAVVPTTRVITIPDFLFDQFFGRHASTWDGGTNLAYGLEFILRDPKSNEFVFSLEWSDTSLRDEWWVEADKPARQADWTEFGMTLLDLGAAYNAWWPISDVFAFYAGAGLGLAVVIGDVYKTDPRQECIVALGASKDYNQLEVEPCEVDGRPAIDLAKREPEDDIPPVIPTLNLAGGAQVTIKEHLALRFDFGFKYYFYGGIGIGYQWW